MRSTRHLSLIDLMAVVGATGVGLTCVKLFPPSHRSYAAQFVIGPVVGILWHRVRGGRGILGGTLGGAAYAAIHLAYIIMQIIINNRIADMDLLMFTARIMLIYGLINAIFGAVLGCTAWLMATAMGRPRVPKPSVTTSAHQVDPNPSPPSRSEPESKPAVQDMHCALGNAMHVLGVRDASRDAVIPSCDVGVDEMSASDRHGWASWVN